MTDEDISRKEIEDYDELCNKCIHKNLCEITRIYTGIDVYYCEQFTSVLLDPPSMKWGDEK